MAMTRSTPVAGPDGTHEGLNTTTPFIDQNQTYTSHASHQVFLREYALDANGRPVATGHLLDGQQGGLPTWADVKQQARDILGIELSDLDVVNIPLIRTDAYGEFVRDPVTGFAQVVIGLGPDGIPNTDDDITASGTPAAPVNTFAAGAVRIGHAFLDDIAHAAAPLNNRGQALLADADSDIGLTGTGTYDNELLDRHFITGDGRGNENIGLSAVHHIFHQEHNRQVEQQKTTILASGNLDFINEWLLTDITEVPADPSTLNWDGERLFQAGRFATEMQYQHLVFEEFARKIQPDIDPFVFNNVTDINPAIFAEFANVVYRFGHSMLTDTVSRTFADGTNGDVDLITAFLNPVLYDNDQTIHADEAAGALVRGMTAERGNEIDEFIVSSLRNNLVGLPLDLAAINIARGRDTGMPTFNEARAQLYAQTGSVLLKPYASWAEMAAQMSNPVSIINFIAAYGQHSTILAATTLAEKRDAAIALVIGGYGAPADRVAFLTGAGGVWTAENSGLNDVDL
ncbi:MAG: peroxidase family protein, partial [Paracoccaceae bacterium]